MEFICLGKRNYRKHKLVKLSILVAFTFLYGLNPAFSQGSSYRKHMPIYDLRGGFRASDWLVEPLITYLAANDITNPDLSIYGETENYFSDKLPGGKLGLGLAVGRHWMLNQDVWFIESFELSAFFKRNRGTENLENGIIQNAIFENEIGNFNHQGNFSTTWAGISARLNHYVQISDKSFIRNALGFNAGYLVSSNQTTNGLNPGSNYLSDENIAVQLNYRLGLGFKMNSFTYLIPFIDFHFISAYPWHGIRAAEKAFNSHYMPITFGVQLKWLRKKRFKGCPQVKEAPKL